MQFWLAINWKKIIKALSDIVYCNYVDIEIYNKKIKESDLVVMQLNIRGLVSKQHDLDELLNKLHHKVYVIILSETWLNTTNK